MFKYQRIKLTPLEIMRRNNGPHDGAGVTFTGDADNLPPLPDGESWVVVEDRPTPGANQRVERELTDEKYGWKIIDLTEEEIVARVPEVEGVTKLTIMRRLGDKWPMLKETLAQLPETVQDAWSLAQEIKADDPLFVEFRPQLQTLLDLTDEEFEALLIP